jgi:hypothetical protein
MPNWGCLADLGSFSDVFKNGIRRGIAYSTALSFQLIYQGGETEYFKSKKQMKSKKPLVTVV